MASPIWPARRLSRTLLLVAVVALLLQVVGLVLFQAGGSAPPARGPGEPLELSRT